jgi:hypothetical protein
LICLVSIIVMAFSIPAVFPKSILVISHDARQQIFERGNLYPSVWMSRLFQNKVSIVANQAKFNLFALIDPSNYFFNFHPREIVADNQNLDKFPFITFLLFFIGMYKLPTFTYRKYLYVVLTGLFLNLLFLINFDRYDLALYLPMSLVILYGLKFVKNLPVLLVLLTFILFQYIHLLLGHA